ncbi:MAG: response regulator transcription factor [Nitrospirota bacterium]
MGIKPIEKKTILLVEDDGVVRDVLREVLEKDYKILVAWNYSETVKHLENNIDLALIDYSLPDKNGFEVLKAIREAKPALPAIIITAYGTEHIAIKAVRAGVTDYIKKPISLKYLKSKVSEILEGKKDDKYLETVEGRKEFIIDGIALYLEDNYMEDMTRDKLARMVCLDRYELGKLFKERFGKSLISYLNHIRIENTTELLKNKDLSITEIAYSVGYGSVDHFNRVFKETYGEPPREYRRKLK